MSEVQISVIDGTSGLPLPGVEVITFLVHAVGKEQVEAGLDPHDRQVDVRAGTTDEAGRCTLSAEFGAGETVEVWPVARARGHAEWRAPQIRGILWDGHEPPAAPTLGAVGSVRFDIVLRRGPTLRGTVKDIAGRPIAAAELGLVLARPDSCCWPHAFALSRQVRWPPPVHTDDRGRFEWLSYPFEWVHMDPGAHFVMTAEHEEFAPGLVQCLESLPADEKGVVEVSFTLEAGATLTGIVRGPDGTPVPKAAINATARPDHDHPVCIRFTKATTTDASGCFRICGLRRRRHTVQVESSDAALCAHEVDLTREDSLALELRLEAGLDLEGILLDAQGRAVVGERVWAFAREPAIDRRTQSDESGRFRLPGLPVRGRVEVGGPLGLRLHVDLPSPPLALRLPRHLDLHVRVVAEGALSSAIEPAVVHLMGPGFSRLLRVPCDSTASACVPAGSYELRADVPDHGAAVVNVVIPEEGLPAPIEIRVPRGGELRGTVTDASGRPVAGAPVWALRPGRDSLRFTHTDAAGGYLLRGLESRFVLAIAAAGHALFVQPIRPGEPGLPARADVVLGAGATIRGRVTRRDGTPLVRARVTVTIKDLPHFPCALPDALTDADGRFILDHVPAGEVVVAHGTAAETRLARDGDELALDLATD